MAAPKCINHFSALSSANIRTGPEMNIGDGNFELKPALINMVQQSSFCGKALEDANAHLQHFLKIFITFTIHEITQDVVHHIHHPRNHPGRGTYPHFSILLIGEGKAVVLLQQGSCIHLGEVLQCISHKKNSIGQDECPPKQDLELSTSHGRNHYQGMGAIAGLYLCMPTPQNG
jgi:hypothetical protein